MIASSPFIGRTRQLRLLDDELAKAAVGRPRIVWVEGESGIGKTQLVRRFLTGAPAHRLIDASGELGESSLTFGVVDQLWRALQTPGPGGSPTPSAVSSSGVDPLVMGAELLTALGSIDGPVVLVVDDLQWIDLESARSLLFLLRRLQAEPIMVVLISQPDPALRLGQAWARLLDDVERVTHIRLDGLAPEELIELASTIGQGTLSHSDARRFHGHTRGHPLHARSLLEELGVAGLRTSRGVLPAPRSLAALVAAKVAALPGPAQDFVAAGAVLGACFAPEVAAMVGRVDDPIEALEAAMGGGLLERRVDGAVAFPHPLLHGAVYTDLSPTRRCGLHSAAAALTSGPVSLHHRVSAAAAADAGLAAELTELAAVEADAGAHARAADHLEAAARLAELPETRERLVLEAVEMMHAGGDFARAAAKRADVEGCAEGAQRTFVLGLMAFAAGRLTEAETLLAQTVAASGGEVVLASWRTRAASTLAFVRLQLGNWQAALEAAETALAGELTWERSVSTFAIVLSLAQLGRIDEAMQRLADASSGDARDRPGTLDILAARGMAKLLDDDAQAAAGDLATVARRARAGEPIRMYEFALGNLGEAQYRLGQWDEALFNAELAVSLAMDAGRGPALVHAHTVAAAICAYRGRYGDAEAHLRDADAVMSQSDSWLSRALVAMSRAILADIRDDPAGMAAAMGEPFGGAIHAGLADVGPAGFRVLVIEALLGTGRIDEAAAAIGHFDALLRRRARPSYRADAARFRGLLAEANDDVDAATAAYERGLEASDGQISGRFARARLGATYGRLLSRLDRRRTAIEHLRAARETFAELGAAPFVARCDAELVRCGLPTRSDAERDPLMLTDAELRVARLVADGLTNRETANQLYVSPKTVEYHLGNVYTKLGISSRWKLADRLFAQTG